MKRQPTPQRLTHAAASRAFDRMDDARSDLDATLAVLSSLVDHDIEHATDHIVAVERYLKTDLANLRAAMAKAREAILTPLEAEPPSGDTQSGGGRATVCSLVVDKAGDAS